MRLRNILLLYFAALVVVILIAFGLSAYQVADDYVINMDKDLIESLVDIEAKELALEYRHNQSVEYLVSHLDNHKAGKHIWLLVTRNFQILNSLPHGSAFLNMDSGVSFKDMIASEKTSDIFTYNEQRFIWAKAKLAETEFTLVHLYMHADASGEYFNKLSTRLMVVAIVIFWVAVWAALIMSTVITRRVKEQQEKIEYQANHDVLTGLQNRYYLANKINAIIAAKKVASLAVIIIGINRFREINDTLGHDFGDLLLQEFGNRMQAEFWADDTIARFGSDQYSLLLPLSEVSHWKIVVDKIDNILKTPFLIQEIHIIVDVSIGISVFPGHGSNAAQLLRSAEVAMFMAKKTGSLYECYDPGSDPNSLDRLQLISELNYAIDKGELELHFQPKISIKEHRMISCEALLRWNNAARGRIPPDVFIPLAEQGSIIKNLTEWVLDESVRYCAACHQSGKVISVAVNLSARLLIEDEILNVVAGVLQKYKLGSEYLILEITESAIMIDPIRAHKIMAKFRIMGVQLSIDDFGTGYTSMSQIKNMAVSEIKIDKSFVMNMLHDKGDAMLVKLIIDMAHGMGHVVVAEGIESQEVLDALRSLGCDIAQGYFLGRPMPAAQFDHYSLN